MSVYQEEGFKNRTEYLKNLAEEFDLPFATVCMIASLLGPSEDFDGLITALDDYSAGMGLDF